MRWMRSSGATMSGGKPKRRRRLKVPPRPGVAGIAALAALTGSCAPLARQGADIAASRTIVPITEARLAVRNVPNARSLEPVAPKL